MRLSGDLRRPSGRRRSLTRALGAVELVLILTGGALLGTWALARAERGVVESYEGWRLRRAVSHARSAATTAPGTAGARAAESPNPPATAAAPPLATETKGRDDRLIGRILIPRLHVSAIVLEGVDAATLRVAVGHLPGTPLPGQGGNAALAAHRDSFFRPLARVRRGDLITFVRPSGTFDYRVVGTRVVSPDDLDVIRPTREPTLTLLTCYPFSYIGPAPERFVVRAVRVRAGHDLPPTVAERVAKSVSLSSSGSARP